MSDTGTNGNGNPLEGFTTGTLPVVRILSEADQASAGTNSEKLPVAILDTSGRPDIDLGALARLHLLEGETSTVFAWDMEASPEDILIRLTCLYQGPVRVQFALLFRYSQHREFLRWVLDHNGAVPIADQEWAEHQEPDDHLVLLTNDDGFAHSLRLLRIRQLQFREQPAIELEEMARVLFEIKRCLSYGELARFASEVLEIPVRGTDSEMLPDAFRGPEASFRLEQLSRQFHVLILRVMLLEGITSGYYNGMVYFFTEDWLAEHNGRPPEA